MQAETDGHRRSPCSARPFLEWSQKHIVTAACDDIDSHQLYRHNAVCDDIDVRYLYRHTTPCNDMECAHGTSADWHGCHDRSRTHSALPPPACRRQASLKTRHRRLAEGIDAGQAG